MWLGTEFQGARVMAIERTQALEAYLRVREASRIELDVEREGQKLHLTYSIR